jgi:hypothetical protein
MENPDHVMGAKLNCKTHLQNTFFDFLAVLAAVAKNFKRSTKNYIETHFDEHG